MKTLYLGLILLLFFGKSKGFAQQPPQRIQFEHLTVADGLPENSVTCMIQDHLGFMWLGTQNGLVRYDGTKMTSFHYDPKNIHSLKGAQIRALCEDRNGDVWVGCESLFRFDRASQRFVEYPQKSSEKVNIFDRIFFIYEDKQGDIWTIKSRFPSESYVLDRFNPKTNTWTYFRHNPKIINSLANNSIYLSNKNHINNFAFLEDNTGKIWVTTRGQKENTLHWLDRKTDHFIRFKPTTNPEITEDFKTVTSIALAKNGQLYLSSFNNGKGLFLLNQQNGQIKQYKHDPNNSNSPRNDSLTSVYQDRSGLVWVPTRQGLDRLDPKTGIFTHFVSKPNDSNSPSSGLLKFLHEMPNGDMWFVTSTGLNFYHRQSNKFVRYENTPNQIGELDLGSKIYSFLVDRTGLIWVGTWEAGINKQSRITKFPLLTNNPNNPNSLQSSRVMTIYEAPSEPSVIWFGSDKGLDNLDKKTGNYTHYQHDSLNKHSLGKGIVTAIAEDKKGRFWIGTQENGLYTMNRKTGQFTRFEPNLINPNNSMLNYIYKILPASDGTLWIMDKLGIDHIDIEQNKFTYYCKADSTYTPELFTLLNQLSTPKKRIAAILHPGNNVDKTVPFTLTKPTEIGVVAEGDLNSVTKADYGWIEDSKGKIVWEMSYENSRSDGHFTMRIQPQLLKLAAGSYRLRYKSDMDFCYGAWPTTPPYHPEFWGIQLLQVTNDESENFDRLIRQKFNRVGLSDNGVRALREDSKKQIWNGTNFGGVNHFNPITGKFKTTFDYFNGPFCTLALLEDTKTGGFWAGDYAYGLIKLDANGKVIKRYNATNGLSCNSVFGIQQDEKGYLWLSTNNGLCRFDPKREKFQTYNLSNNLQDLSFHLFASFKASDGEIYFGGRKGVNAFYPNQLQDDPFLPQVILSDFSILGKTATLGKDQQMPVHISIASTIILPHDQNDFTFHFVALHYSRGKDCQYIFRLAPYDKDWVASGTVQQARYTDMDAGTYTFQVKAANADGVWNEKGTSITITILPPWWRTWWAYTLYFLAFAGLLRAYIAFRSRTLRRENRILEEKVSLRTTQLEHKSTELEHSLDNLKTTQNQLIQKEKLASLGELTAGIAHEIQNPLNFVNNFSEMSVELIQELLQEENKPLNTQDPLLKTELLNDLSANQAKINHHGKRASSIVSGMLEHSRSGTGERTMTDINKLADEYLRLSYNSMRAKQKDQFNSDRRTADYELIADENLPLINVVPQDIGRVLLNLINNAFYAVNGKDNPKVKVSTKHTESHVLIKVQDNGVGMSEATQAKIFQPFFTTKPTGEGTGLGLSLAYDIVTKGHGGTIELESVEGEGTTFIVKLPISQG